jgi:hypothetical protein
MVEGGFMKKLLEVFLVLTVLGLGVTYGYYDFRVERGYRGSYLSHLGEIPGKIQKKIGKSPRLRRSAAQPKQQAGDVRAKERPEREQPEAELPLKESGYVRRTFQPEREESETPKRRFLEYQVKLDEADRVIMAASTYYKLAVMKAERRQEYARKILDSTEDTLRTLDELNEKFPDQPEIEERLQEIHRLRQFAVKELGARQPDGKRR